MTMRPAGAGLAGTRPAGLVLAATGAELLLDTLSPNTEGALLQALGGSPGDFDDLAGAWLVGKGTTPRGQGGLEAQLSLLPARAQLRCIDGTHGAGCTACTAPPEEGEEANYELTGEVGKKNGEKRCARRPTALWRAAPRICGGQARRLSRRRVGTCQLARPLGAQGAPPRAARPGCARVRFRRPARPASREWVRLTRSG